MSDGTHAEAPLIVGVSGLRGIVGHSLTSHVAANFACAFGTWLSETMGPATGSAPVVLVARDGRAGGEAMLHAAIASLLVSGCCVINIGVATTPTIGVNAGELGASAGIIITASHNPQEWNGLKPLISDAVNRVARGEPTASMDPDEAGLFAPPAEVAQRIIDTFHALRFVHHPPLSTGRLRTDDAAADRHTHRVVHASGGIADEMREGRATGMRVVVDSVNASGAGASASLFGAMGIHHVQLHGSPSGIFPHTPEPTRENLADKGGLCYAVRGLGASIGFAQDPDADRLAIVDEMGEYIGEEYTLALCAEALLSESGGKGDAPERGGRPVLVANLSTSRMIDDVAARHGAEVVRTPVGEANVVERMKRLRAEGRRVVLGGEGNGGVIWPEVVYVRDSLSAMVLVLSLMARTGKTVSELVRQINSYSPSGAARERGYAIVKRKAPLRSKQDAVPVVERIAAHYRSDQSWSGGADGGGGDRVDTQDGVRIDFADGGPRAGTWVHVRASNTEPIMRLICEAASAEIAEGVLAEVKAVIAGR